ncbi:unnamed protein product [Oppiella nova]|uniref:N-acetylneuraminate lyase n=1 Tax=Oppiella nova TaxID=334625 RepID=A0A7R9MD41_9ACAR|nr:unnamed protein product [Oppiella nova]CAG2175021.1 unnamed protein product [Oppiella nova]
MSSLFKLIPRKERLLKFRGAMAPVLTPYDKNGEVNVSQIPKYVKYLVDNKVDGLYILGTNGEGYNLTNDERLSIVKAWRQALDKHQANLVSVVNVSSYCVKEALDLSKHVESMGFDAIAVLPPNYYKPNSVDDWLNFLKGFEYNLGPTLIYQ